MEVYYNELFILFARFFIAAMFLPVIVAFWHRKSLNKSLRIFLLYCIITILINLLEQLFIWAVDTYTAYWIPIIEKWGISDTNFLQILYYLNNFAFLGWFYYSLLSSNSATWLKHTTALLFLAALVNYLFIEGYQVYGVFNPAADAIFSFILPLFYLWFLYSFSLNVPVYKNSYFWLSFGLIFINLLTLFLYFAGDKMHQTDFVLFAKIGIIKNCLGIIGQIFLAIGFWYAPYVKYLSPPQRVENFNKTNV